jgi:hypothetical protein
MPETAPYSFDLKEATAALIKDKGLHEGLWAIGFEMVLGAGLFGPSPAESKPGAIMQINKLQLVRAAPGTPEAVRAVDAAVVNPRAKSRRRRTARS